MGSGISAVASPLLITELCHPQQRGKITAVYNTFWYFGSTIAAWTTFGTLQIHSNLSWRLPSLFQFIPSFIQVVLIWFLPESPRFLISRDQNERALAIMTKYHANGNPESEWLKFEFAEIRASLRLEKESAKSQWKDLFRTRKRAQSQISHY
jgi:MFS family permease